MTSIITWAGATTPIVPLVIDGYDSSRQSGTVVHPIAGRADPDVTLAPAGLRTGTLRLVFADETDAKTAEDEHAEARAFTLSDDDRATVAMYYVVDAGGDITRSLDDTTRDAWVVEVPFQEISP